MAQISSFSHLFAAVALSVCVSASLLFAALLHQPLALCIHLISFLPAMFISHIFLFDVQNDVLFFFY